MNKLLSFVSIILVLLLTNITKDVNKVSITQQKQRRVNLVSTLDAPVYAQEQKVNTISSQEQNAPKAVLGTCEDWMTQAGVEITYSSKTLIMNESGCRPNAVNPSSGACGIAQALPCSKMPCTLEDPVCQLRWMDQYIKSRYTTWENALSFWNCIGSCSNNYGTINKTTTWY